MRKPNNKLTRLYKDLKALKIGDSLAHSVNLELRQAAYAAAKPLDMTLCIREILLKPGKFQVTRIS